MVEYGMFKFGIILAIVIIAIILTAGIVWQFAIHPNSVKENVITNPSISIAFNNDTYEPNTAAKITVIDPSANTNDATREKIFVQVYSDSDPIGIHVQLEEHRTNSSDFITHPYLVKLTTLSTDSSIDALQIKTGDKIYAKYGGSNTTASIITPVSLPNVVENTSSGGGGLNMTGSTNPSVLTNSFVTSGGLNQFGVSISATPIPVLGCFDDIDNDGICDEWENGSTGNDLQIPYGNTIYDLHCDPTLLDPDTNANDDCPGTDMKDIYVQASYLQNTVISQAPTSAVISDLKKIFYTHYPYPPNTPSSQHIRLHFLLDPVSVGYYNDLITVPGNPTDQPGAPSFFGIKNAYFGSPQERTSCSTPPPGYTNCNSYLHDLLTAKSQVFHYALFIHGQAAQPGSSGWSEIFGNDIVVSMGAFTNGVGSENEMAGTFMHELGHNLDLNHGGAPLDQQNCKPNYLSVMSYTRQFPYVAGLNWNLNYSGVKYADLDETKLNEGLGIGTTKQKVTGFSPNGISVRTGPATLNSAAIDWDQNNKISSRSVSTEIQYLNVLECQETTKTILSGFDDWSNMKLAYQSSSNFANGAAVTPSSAREMTRGDVDTLFMNEYGVNSTGKNLEELYKTIVLKENKDNINTK